jgi:hypothetical protein
MTLWQSNAVDKLKVILGRLVCPSLLLIIAVHSLQQAHAWQTGVDQDMPIAGCTGAPMNGADVLALRVKPVKGSYGLPVLVGLKDGKTLWSLNLPQAEEINAAKTFATCKGNRGRKGEVIDVASQHPGNAPWTIQRFRWDGQAVKKLGEWDRR